MGPQRRLDISLTGDVFIARFSDCHFNETNFPTLARWIHKLEKEITWNASSLSHLDPHTNQHELEVQKISNKQNIANQVQDAFTNAKKVSHIHQLKGTF